MSEDWRVPVDTAEDKAKMVLVWRKDLKVPKGKIGAQLAHAAVGATIQAIFGKRLEESDFVSGQFGTEINEQAVVNDATKDWLAGEFTKITVSVENLEELEAIEAKAREADLNVVKITDNGHTCFDGVPTVTCLAIGPCYASEVDPITRDLKLF